MPGVYMTPLLDKYYGLSLDEVMEPEIPIHYMVSESKTLEVLAIKHRDRLMSLNLDWSYVERLVPAANALQEAEIELMLANFGTTELADAWEKLSSEAMMNREQLFHVMDYAFDGDPKLLDALQAIRSGSGYADLAQDEGKLEGLGIKYKHLLDACNIDYKLVERAGQLKIELGDMLAKVNVEKMEKSPEKMLRDRAYTWLYIAVTKIRKCGKSVFYLEPDIAGYFASAYLKKVRMKYERKKKIEQKAAEAVVVS